jgi:hypothetical protein
VLDEFECSPGVAHLWQPYSAWANPDDRMEWSLTEWCPRCSAEQLHVQIPGR